MSAEDRRANLKQELRREIDSNSRLLSHTKASGQKVNSDKPIVVPSTSHLKEIAEGAADTSKRRADSPRRPDAFYRHFHSTAAKSCIVQEKPQPALSPVRSRSFKEAPQGSLSAGEIERAGPVKKSGPFPHHKNIVLPTEDKSRVGEPHSKLWLRRPLTDGSRHAQSKKLFPNASESVIGPPAEPGQALGGSGSGTNTPSRRSDSPSGGKGKRRITQESHIVGCNAEVTSMPKPRNPHVVPQYHKRETPYYEPALSSPDPDAAKKGGLLGYGPTGKKQGNRPDTRELLDHKDKGWGKDAPGSGNTTPRGVRMVVGKSHVSIDPCDPKSAPKSQEQLFRPSIHVMSGPPAFVPQPAASSRTNSPGRRFIDPGTSDIFGANPRSNSPQPVVRTGRAAGRYSPMRQ